jgi:hypothetical protein
VAPLADLEADVRRGILGGNAAKLYDIPLP